MIESLIITLAILVGQTIKLPFNGGGVSILDIVITAFCLYGLIKSKLKFKLPPSFIQAAISFIVVCIISLAFTPLPLKFNDYLNAFSYIVRFSIYILFSYLLYLNIFPNIVKKIRNILLFSGVELSILGLAQFFIFPDLSFLTKWGWDPHYFRTVSTFLDPNFAGAFFVLSLLFIFSQTLKKSLYKIGFILIFLALLTTFSRSSYLMFLIGGISLSFLNKSKKIFLKTFILFFILIIGFQIYTQMISKPRNISREQSASFRLTTWQQGIRLFETYPLLGVGFNAYRYALKTSSLGDEQFINSHGASSNDSSLLFVAATTGIIGFFTYLGFLIFLLKEGLRENPILFASISGLLIHSIFANSLFFSPIFLWVLLISINPKK